MNFYKLRKDLVKFGRRQYRYGGESEKVGASELVEPALSNSAVKFSSLQCSALHLCEVQ